MTGYFENVKCWLCAGGSWLKGLICIECNPYAKYDEDAIVKTTQYRQQK